MRPSAGQPLDQPGDFRGPFASGAPAIFAVAAARLGLKTGFIGAVGEDAFGRLMRNRFAVEGVDASQLQTPPGFATGAAFVAYDHSGGREFVFHIRHAAAGQLTADRIPAAIFQKPEMVASFRIDAGDEREQPGCLPARHGFDSGPGRQNKS